MYIFASIIQKIGICMSYMLNQTIDVINLKTP